MVTDPIADFIVRIKNSAMAGAKALSVPHSKLKESMAKILKEEGFITGFEVVEEEGKKNIVLTLVSEGNNVKPVEVKRISKPGRRVYIKAKDIANLRGLGLTIISTPAGLMGHRQALAKGMGGELLCKLVKGK